MCVCKFVDKHVHILGIVHFHEITINDNLLFYGFVKHAISTKNASLHEA